MKMKKCVLIILILAILLNISGIYATQNNTIELEINNENNLETCEDALLQTDELSQTNQEILTQNTNEEILDDFLPSETQITLTVNDTEKFETTNNITINMHFSFTTPLHNGEFTTNNISIYENNTLIKTLNIGEQNIPELEIRPQWGGTSIYYETDILFNYTVHDDSYLTTSLFGVYSNTLQFEKLKTNIITNLNNTQINIDNKFSSNTTWNNSIGSLKKALNYVKNNGTIYLNNINLIQDISETIVINRNITIVGNKATFTLKNNTTLLQITPNTQVVFINLTFKGNNPYIISNNGNLQLVNCTFKDNSNGLIDNNGKLEIKNTKFNDILQLNQDSSTNTEGLINNNGILTITESEFNNNIILPYNIPTKNDDLKAIIKNNNELLIDNTNFTNINHRIIYNMGKLTLTNNKFENIISTSALVLYRISFNTELTNQYTYNTFKIYSNEKNMDGGALYSTNETFIINCVFKNIWGNNGGCIYNTGKVDVKNSLINKSQSNFHGGSIYNDGRANLNNISIIESKVHSESSKGGGIYNNGILTITNSQINKCSAENGGGMYNNNIINITNSIISECSGSGAGIYNTKSINMANSQIINNYGSTNYRIRYEQSYTYYDAIYSGIIYNAENANMQLNKSLIKDNYLFHGDNLNWVMYYGTIKNDGNMEIYSCIFDHNIPKDWRELQGGEGSINIYNTAKITIKYCYLLNTQYYKYYGINARPLSIFLYNTKTATLNYNFYCLNPSSIIRNANPNYYFIPSFDDDYYPIEINQNINITLTLSLTNGTDTIQFNDWDKLPNSGLNMSIYMNNKTEKILDALLQNNITFKFNNTDTKGEWTLLADFGGYTTNTIVDIGKEFADMTVEYNNITYNDGNNVTFKINVTDNNTPVSGNITLTFNNQKYQIRLNNGTCNFTMPSDLKPNNYTVKIEYNGNEDYFKIRNRHYQFTIHKIQTNITLDAPEVKIGQNGELTIKISPSTANMNGILYVNGKAKTRADTNSIRIINLKNYGVGIYNLTVVFDDDEYYIGGSASTLFIVSKYDTNMTIEASDIKAGENETLNITINPGEVRGSATLQINTENSTIWINNTITPITLTDLKEGTYQVTVYYPGDSKYAPSTATATFSVSRITSHLTVDLTQNINLTGHIKIQANPLNCTGEVAIYINNDITVLNLSDGEISTQVKLKRGSNYIYIHYNGDRYYSISSWNTSFIIDGMPVLTLESQDLSANSTGYVRVNLTDTNNIPYEYTNITVEFQNTTHTLTTDEKGIVYYPINTGAGTYTFRATYENITLTKTLTVKTLTSLSVNIENINQADDLIVHAALTDSDNNKLTGEVMLEINGQYYKIIITDGMGSRNLGEFKNGLYSYTATYPGEALMYSSNATGTFQVKENNYKITGNKNIIQYYGASKTYKIRLLNNNQPVKNEIITIKISKNTLKVKTDNQGYATLKLSLKAGKYTITSTYKNVKVSNKITVKPTLITKNKKIKKGKTLTYTAKLLNKNGKKQKNKKITFKINGKKYKAKTNKKGIAKIKVKNLKKGKYKIITTYGKQKNTNWITVKK